MRALTDTGLRVIAAMLAGAALVGLAALASDLLPRGGLLDALGGRTMLAGLAAFICGVCALGMSLGLRLRPHPWRRVIRVGLVATAIVWGVCLSAAAPRVGWARLLAGLPGLTRVAEALAIAGASVIFWLPLFVTLAGLLAGLRRDVSSTARALTSLWLTPLWGGSVGAVYGILAYAFYIPPPLRNSGLPTSPWDGLRVGLTLGVGMGLILGLTLTFALRLSLIVRPVRDDRPIVIPRHAPAS
ncbi:MAG TPA: hypothetical protein VE338_12500 [Ktedonobacterales bacterium]|jgi:MFS family permease|nr:hypothetical protein [Ktedonobacterales bacterium]